MYIWILLATIMVALSFLNTSPREDKAGVFTEIKAATVANRFRAEHLAFYRGTECEMLYNYKSDNYKRPFLCTKENNCLAKMEENLPVGYDLDGITTESTHAIFCFSGQMGTSAASLSLETCSSEKGSKNKYAVSFATIPERWLSKTTTKVTYTYNSNNYTANIITPTPNFTNYLAKELSGVKNVGWVWCTKTNKTCHLVGRTAVQVAYEKDPENSKGSIAKYVKFIFPSVLTSLSYAPSKAFQEKCMSGKPCLFAFDKYRNTDTGGHCKASRNNSGI